METKKRSQTYTLTEFADHIGLTKQAVHQRVHRHLQDSVEDTIRFHKGSKPIDAHIIQIRSRKSIKVFLEVHENVQQQ